MTTRGAVIIHCPDGVFGLYAAGATPESIVPSIQDIIKESGIDAMIESMKDAARETDLAVEQLDSVGEVKGLMQHNGMEWGWGPEETLGDAMSSRTEPDGLDEWVYHILVAQKAIAVWCAGPNKVITTIGFDQSIEDWDAFIDVLNEEHHFYCP